MNWLETLIYFRKKQGLNQDELAEMANIGGGKSSISQMENGKIVPRIDTIEKIAESMGLVITILEKPKKDFWDV